MVFYGEVKDEKKYVCWDVEKSSPDKNSAVFCTREGVTSNYDDAKVYTLAEVQDQQGIVISTRSELSDHFTEYGDLPKRVFIPVGAVDKLLPQKKVYYDNPLYIEGLSVDKKNTTLSAGRKKVTENATGKGSNKGGGGPITIDLDV